MNEREALWRLLVATTFTLACAPDPPVLAEDANLVLRGPEGEQICAGTFARSSAEVEAIRASFRPSTGAVEYMWMREADVDDEDFPCESSDYACSRETTVYARTLGSTHELVHAARSPGLPRILEEGLATLLDEPTAQEQELADRAEFEAALTSSSWVTTNAFYERAAHFVSFLVAWGGWSALRALEDEFPARDDAWLLSPEGLDAALLEVYGLGLADVLAEYEGYPDCEPAQFHQAVSACALLESSEPAAQTIIASLGDGDGSEQALLAVDCERESAYGPIDRGPLTVAEDLEVDVELPFATSVVVELMGERGPGSTVWLSNCGDCWSGSGAIVSSDSPSALANLESGPHVLTIHQAVDVSGELGIELSY